MMMEQVAAIEAIEDNASQLTVADEVGATEKAKNKAFCKSISAWVRSHPKSTHLNLEQLQVIGLLKYAKKQTPVFTLGQVAQLSVEGAIAVTPYDSFKDYALVLNRLSRGEFSITNKRAARTVSYSLHDLLESKELPKKLVEPARELWYATGAHVRIAKVSNPMSLLLASYNDLTEGALKVLTPTSELSELGVASTKLVKVHYSCCNTVSETSCEKLTAKLKHHEKAATPVRCGACSSNTITLQESLEKHREILADSRIYADKLTPEQLLLPSGTKEKVTLFFGCCSRYQEISGESLKTKLARAYKLNFATIACNDCKVPQGQLEGRIFEFLSGIVAGRMKALADYGVPYSATVEKQFHYADRPSFPYDMAVTCNGVRTIIEVDGGRHYSQQDNSLEEFTKRVAVDQQKTLKAINEGDHVLRIDERYIDQTTPEIQAALQLAIIGKSPRYQVIGKECPGALEASTELRAKGVL